MSPPPAKEGLVGAVGAAAEEGWAALAAVGRAEDLVVAGPVVGVVRLAADPVVVDPGAVASEEVAADSAVVAADSAVVAVPAAGPAIVLR